MFFHIVGLWFSQKMLLRTGLRIIRLGNTVGEKPHLLDLQFNVI